jgi:hypothetical protein
VTSFAFQTLISSGWPKCFEMLKSPDAWLLCEQSIQPGSRGIGKLVVGSWEANQYREVSGTTLPELQDSGKNPLE